MTSNRFTDSLSLTEYEEIESVCNSFEECWQRGARPLLREFIDRGSLSIRQVLMRELLLVDIDYQARAGNAVNQKDYLRDFPDLSEAVNTAFVEATARGSVMNEMTTSAHSPERDITLIGRYRIVREIGQGSFARVFLAEDTFLNREVAIKIPHPTLSHRFQEHLKSEARSQAALDHRNIAQVFDFGVDADLGAYLVSRYIHGDRITSWAARNEWSHTQICAALMELASALEHAHEQGIFHRDLKPANIIVDLEGHPVIVDFGLSLHQSDTGTGSSYVGTPAYMSPEQARRESHHVDRRSDLFSLGVVFYELLARRRPFYADGDHQTLLTNICSSEAPPLQSVVHNVSPKLAAICHKCLQKDPTHRYQSAGKLHADLQRWSKQQKRKRLAIPGIAVLFALIISLFFGFRHVRDQLRTVRANAALEKLLVSNSDALPTAISDIQALPEDSRRFMRAQLENADNDADRLRMTAALVTTDESLKSQMVAQVLNTTFADYVALARLSLGWKDQKDHLWRISHDPNNPESARMRALALLSHIDSSSHNWSGRASFIVDNMISADATEFDYYLQEFRPVALNLIGECVTSLEEEFNPGKAQSEQRKRLVKTILHYGDVAPTVMFRAIRELAGPELQPFADLVVAKHVDVILPLCQKELTARNPIDDERQSRAFANAAALLLRMGHHDRVWHQFRPTKVPTVQSILIHRCAEAGVDPAILGIRLLEGNRLDEKYALYLALGEYEASDLPIQLREQIVAAAREDVTTQHDAGIQGAAEWLLRRWGHDEWAFPMLRESEIQSLDPTVVAFVNERNQKFVVFGPAEFKMGSDHPSFGKNNKPKVRRIDYHFAVATMELSRAEFRFCDENSALTVEGGYDTKHVPTDDAAETFLTWQTSAYYCNWLSDHIGLPESEWCYEPSNSKYDRATRLKENYDKLRGYRMCTELEWEYVCRAGTTSETFYGNSYEIAHKYAHMRGTSEHVVLWPGGHLKPNAFGLFDMFGNNAEHCAKTVELMDDPNTPTPDIPVLRGNNMMAEPLHLSASFRSFLPHDTHALGAGLRLARSLPDMDRDKTGDE